MNTETDYLKSMAEEISAKPIEPINVPLADHRIVLEAKRLEKAIIMELHSIDNFVQRDTFRNDTLGKLVKICDILFNIHHYISPDTMVIIELLAAIRQVIPAEISPALRLPRAYIFMHREAIKSAWNIYAKDLKEQEIDPKLIAIASIPFERFILSNEKLHWGDFTWLKGFQSKLNAIDWENTDCNSKTEALMSLLIGRDFNHDRFYVYCKKYILKRVGAIATKNRRLLEYAVCEKLILEDTQVGLPPFDPHANPVAARLLKWVKEETNALKSSDGEDYVSKIEVIWNVETLALFFKFLWDHKVFKDVGLKDFSKQIALAFSSKGKGDFKPHSIYGRFYVKEREILLTLEALFAAILEDIRRYLQ
jgi:hypothetical protein